MNSQHPDTQTAATFGDRLFALLQYPLPHHLLSRGMHALTRVEWSPLKDLLIRTAIRVYDIDMKEALENDPGHYRSFNHFFTRALRPEARPLEADETAVISPADGTLSQIGAIRNGRIFQAKGRNYGLGELLGGDTVWTPRFEDGAFATVYLSPRDYHRVHMPLDGVLRKMIHVPGRLFSVNPSTTRTIPRLFARNERVVCLFETGTGPMAVILVGAIFVASIDTVWAGAIAPRSRATTTWQYGEPSPAVPLDRGAEMGRFNMGSTVIVLFGKEAVRWKAALQAESPIRMGETIGHIEQGMWV